MPSSVMSDQDLADEARRALFNFQQNVKLLEERGFTCFFETRCLSPHDRSGARSPSDILGVRVSKSTRIEL